MKAAGVCILVGRVQITVTFRRKYETQNQW
jgi:hypothetical protein